MPSRSVPRYMRPTKGCQKVTLKELFIVKIEVFFNTYNSFPAPVFFFLSFFRSRWKDNTIKMASVFVCQYCMCNSSGVLFLITKYIWLEKYL